MKHIVIFGLITIVVFLFKSPVCADEPLQDITGTWYVVAMKDYSDSLPLPRCWSIKISTTPSTSLFQVVSTFIDSKTNDSIVAYANATRIFTHLSYDFVMRSEYQYFNFTVTYGRGQTLDVDSITHWYAPGDHATALMDMIVGGERSKYWDKLFLSRESNLSSNMVPAADYFINNTNCAWK